MVVVFDDFLKRCSHVTKYVRILGREQRVTVGSRLCRSGRSGAECVDGNIRTMR